MHQEQYFVFIIALLVLIATPIIAPFISIKVSQQSKQVKFKLFDGLGGIVVLILLASMLGVSISCYYLNVIVVALGFVFYGIIAVSIFRVRPKYLGVFLGSIFSLPLVGGLLLGTIGFLGLMFILAETVPIYTTTSNSGLSCYVTTFGNATTSESGYDVVLTKPLLMSLFEYRIKEEAFKYIEPSEACNEFLISLG